MWSWPSWAVQTSAVATGSGVEEWYNVMEFSGDRFFILDGGFNGQLAAYLPSCESEPLWGAAAIDTNPDLVKRTHGDYVAAGAQIIETNTYQTSNDLFLEHFNKNREDERNPMVAAVEMYGKAVGLAREAAKGISKGEKSIPQAFTTK
jgi:S-methylmethionine-dependent homocysteine/selenocysteine methylase